MEDGIMDLQADLLKKTLKGTLDYIHKDLFKNAKPFRAVKMSEDEQVDEYFDLDPRVVEKLRQQMPDWAEHENKMRDLIMRRAK